MANPDKDSLPSEAKSITSEDIVTNDSQFGPTLNRNSSGDEARGDFEQNSDAGYADPQTDIDPRTSNTGFTSVGSTDLNAGEAQVAQESEEDVPGVRRDAGQGKIRSLENQ